MSSIDETGGPQSIRFSIAGAIVCGAVTLVYPTGRWKKTRPVVTALSGALAAGGGYVVATERAASQQAKLVFAASSGLTVAAATAAGFALDAWAERALAQAGLRQPRIPLAIVAAALGYWQLRRPWPSTRAR